MLGSIIRNLSYLALVAAATWGVYRMLETPGGVTIAFAGYAYELTPIAFLVLMLAAFFALWLALKLLGLLLAVLGFLSGDDTAFSRFFARNRERRGLDALATGLTALASGDAKTALRKAAKAERLLHRPELTRLLNAQAAEQAGDSRRARIYYRALAREPETAIVGVKGLLTQALEARDNDKALRLAEHAFALKPRDPEVLETLYKLQSAAFDWQGARRTLAAQRKYGYLPKPEADQRDATLALAQSEESAAGGAHESAQRLAIEAARLDPGNVEAVLAATRHALERGQKRAASRHLIDAWRVNPDPRIAAAFADIEPDESPSRRRKRFGRLIEANPSHAESRFLRAELALMAEDWPGARAALAQLDEPEPSARSCAITAAIARGEGEPEQVVRAWLAKALGAPRGEAGDSELSHAAMLPLLVGDEDAEEAEEVPDSEPVPMPEAEDAPGADGPRREPRDGKRGATPETAADAAPGFSPERDGDETGELKGEPGRETDAAAAGRTR